MKSTKKDNPAYNFSSDGVIGGCDSTLVEDRGIVYLDTADGRAIKMGKIGATKKHRAKKTKTQVGDTIFGCCADIVIRDGVVLYPEEPWFFGKNLDTPFTYKEEQPIELTKSIINELPENCKHEFLLITKDEVYGRQDY